MRLLPRVADIPAEATHKPLAVGSQQAVVALQPEGTVRKNPPSRSELVPARALREYPPA